MFEFHEFNQLIGKKINRILIVVWPPTGKTAMADVDISIALELSDLHDRLFRIHINGDDCWTPIISEISSDCEFDWCGFRQRLADWMSGQIDDPLCHEVYDVTRENMFRHISFNEILAIECVTLKSGFNPFAVRFIFRHDYLVVSPISDGSTVETSLFNQQGNLSVFESMGELESIDLKVL